MDLLINCEPLADNYYEMFDSGNVNDQMLNFNQQQQNNNSTTYINSPNYSNQSSPLSQNSNSFSDKPNVNIAAGYLFGGEPTPNILKASHFDTKLFNTA